MFPLTLTYLWLLFLGQSQARNIPANVQELYDSVVAQGSCKKPLQTGFYDMPRSNDNSFVYCGDHLEDYGIIYLQGSHGKLANMDVDCDGAITQNDDGRCGNAHSTRSTTAMRRFVSAYENGVVDLNPFVHDYVVFGNTGDSPGWSTFDPRDYGMLPLSVMAVVCNNSVVYGIWGDTNSDDGVNPRIGESSISIATLCFGTDTDGEAGYDKADILYIGFVGTEAVPGTSAKWQAVDENEFQESIRGLGDTLIQRIGRP
ncbi:glycoside hydrolase family 75 protein [Hypoxylon fragiforme]|uniref:glycoside hydrolase family 75 protein n=1 Tax=Hypoxylon fragiforme TaxID=63214 RepID=UPI0020C6535C|nr:glycoside hydrolase family 75 protein [Hypoxylon fragiforme]KAI2611598.1 glycoside hydrolase family 75 protein [Hypoxylon fragiforme]